MISRMSNWEIGHGIFPILTHTRRFFEISTKIIQILDLTATEIWTIFVKISKIFGQG